MTPASLFAAVLLPLFPLALEIDYGVIAKGAQAPGKTHRLRIVIACASGKGVDSDLTSGRTADPESLRWQLDTTLREMKKWSFYRQGMALVILGYDGSPVKKVDITSNGPKPTARWIPKPR
jgi:hypothetical protein